MRHLRLWSNVYLIVTSANVSKDTNMDVFGVLFSIGVSTFLLSFIIYLLRQSQGPQSNVRPVAVAKNRPEIGDPPGSDKQTQSGYLTEIDTRTRSSRRQDDSSSQFPSIDEPFIPLIGMRSPFHDSRRQTIGESEQNHYNGSTDRFGGGHATNGTHRATANAGVVGWAKQD
ncbi:MAG: hypothetical protein Q9166_000196 [cf. Caloplaca sp. 2 TL-2023]